MRIYSSWVLPIQFPDDQGGKEEEQPSAENPKVFVEEKPQ